MFFLNTNCIPSKFFQKQKVTVQDVLYFLPWYLHTDNNVTFWFWILKKKKEETNHFYEESSFKLQIPISKLGIPFESSWNNWSWDV